MLRVAAVQIVEIAIGVPLIIIGLLVTAWINGWMKRGKRWP